MALPAPNLDDLRFQKDLVDEARTRIIHYCPEWTEYNLSDPGITLIELFAWMTELMVYRLNQVPEKNYIKFLELLGLKKRPASSARTDLTFWLSVGLPTGPEDDTTVLIPAGLQVRADSADEEILFSTDRDLKIVPPLLAQIRKESDVSKNFLPRMGLEIFYPFDQPRPRQGNTFYIGFDPANDLTGHILQLHFTCEPTEAVGIRREDPPWVWECSTGDGKWIEVPLSTYQGERDTTGGLNNEDGALVLYTPLTFKPQEVHGRNAFWLRCRVEQRFASQGMYTESPRVKTLEARSLGAAVPATHAVVVEREFLGESSGEPGQEFTLQNYPVLDLAEGETLTVEEFQSGENVMVPWSAVTDFSHSARYDRHFMLDTASGKVLLGPSVRQPDGVVVQYGRIPESGRPLIFKRYRYGGGVKGNLPVNSIRTMITTVAYVSRVTNLIRSYGGRDEESMDEVKLRAQRELQAQKRAVTIQDFEQLVETYSRSIGRVKCLNPRLQTSQANAGLVDILIVPAVADSLQSNDLTRLWLSEQFTAGIQRYLDDYRLLTTQVKLREPEYLGVQVKARIVPEEFSDPVTVAGRVDQHLRNYLNPLTVFPEQEEKDHLLEKGWQGWPFGKDLFTAEIFSLIQRVPGVRYVLDVELFTREVSRDSDSDGRNADELPLTPVKDKMIWVGEDTLLCSLPHEISVSSLNDVYGK
jgi:predicted phage baseplate assembly protein